MTLKSAPLLLVQVQLAATRTKPPLVAATPEPRSSRTIKTLRSLTQGVQQGASQSSKQTLEYSVALEAYIWFVIIPDEYDTLLLMVH